MFGYKIYLRQFTFKYVLVFSEAISGLYQGSEVFLNGIPFGSVHSIELDEVDFDKAVIVIKTKKPIPNLPYARAEMTIRSFAGYYGLNISYQKGHALIAPKINGLDQIPVMKSFLSRLKERLEQFATDENLDSMTQNARETIHTIRIAFEEVVSVIKKVGVVIDQLGPSSDKIAGIVDSTQGSINEIHKVLAKIHKIVHSKNISNFVSEDLKTISHIISDAKDTTASFKLLISDFRKNPLRFLSAKS